MTDARPPIFILSHRRPARVAALCEALRNQVGFDVTQHRVYLVQDGAGDWGPAKAKVEECGLTFAMFFPGSAIMLTANDENLGIARNTARAHAFAFRAINARHAYFFEDDLVPGPHYMRVMTEMHDQIVADPILCGSVAQWAAYGDTESFGLARSVTPTLIGMREQWGYGLHRGAWNTVQALLAPFHAEWSRTGYRQRDELAVTKLYRPLGIYPGSAAQDGAFAAACAWHRLARINTGHHHASYMGSVGESTNRDKYDELHYGDMQPVAEAVTPTITQTMVDAIARQQHAAMKARHQTYLEPRIRHLESLAQGS